MSFRDRILVVVWIGSLIIGLIGSLAPVLPWPLLSFCGLLLLQWTTKYQFNWSWIVIFGILTIVSFIIDYYLPIRGTKKYWWTQAGVIGSTIGMIAGIFLFPPLGMILFPFVGAFLWEYLISNRSGQKASHAAWWSFVGFILGSGYKLILCGWMILRAFQHIF